MVRALVCILRLCEGLSQRACITEPFSIERLLSCKQGCCSQSCCKDALMYYSLAQPLDAFVAKLLQKLCVLLHLSV